MNELQRALVGSAMQTAPTDGADGGEMERKLARSLEVCSALEEQVWTSALKEGCVQRLRLAEEEVELFVSGETTFRQFKEEAARYWEVST